MSLLWRNVDDENVFLPNWKTNKQQHTELLTDPFAKANDRK